MRKQRTAEEFIARAREIHGDADDFSKVEYRGSSEKVCITCKIHGDYWIRPALYLRGQRCPECGKRTISEKRFIGQDGFLRRVREIYGDRYDFSKSVYTGALDKVEVVCPEHGSFWVTPAYLWKGHACPKCSANGKRGRKFLTYDEFVTRAMKVHDGKYDYHDDYVDAKTKVRITCPIHGDFYQRPDAHLSGSGCPKCNSRQLRPIDKIYGHLLKYIPSHEIVRDDTSLLNGQSLDIYIPSLRLGIAFNVIRLNSEEFVSDKNHLLHKTLLAESKGVHLIQIFEDEFKEHEDLVLEKLVHFIGKSSSVVVGARKCVIRAIGKDDARSFLERFHIQGFVPSSVYLGAFYGHILVGVMSFKVEGGSNGKWNLTRFSTDFSYSLPGLASKMFKFFRENYDVSEVKTFLDRRWSYCDVNVYDKMGFVIAEKMAPDYRYVVGNERMHKFGFRKGKMASKFGMSNEKTEHEMALEAGLYRIWDCGLIKYVWRKGDNN